MRYLMNDKDEFEVFRKGDKIFLGIVLNVLKEKKMKDCVKPLLSMTLEQGKQLFFRMGDCMQEELRKQFEGLRKEVVNIEKYIKIAKKIKFYQENDPCHHRKNELIIELRKGLGRNKENYPVLSETHGILKEMEENLEEAWEIFDPNPDENFELIDTIIKKLNQLIDPNIKEREREGKKLK